MASMGHHKYLLFTILRIFFHLLSSHHRITKKYILPRAFHIPRIFILCQIISLRIIVSSYHEKIYLTHAEPFIYLGFFMLCHYFSLCIKVSSYHQKIYLTQGLSYTSDFYIMSLFITSYHRITKNISYSGPFIYLGFLYYVDIIYHFVSLYHEKIYLTRAFIYFGFFICHYFSLRIIVSSYHEKIYLTQGFSYTSDFLYYVIIQIPRTFVLCHYFHFVS